MFRLINQKKYKKALEDKDAWMDLANANARVIQQKNISIGNLNEKILKLQSDNKALEGRLDGYEVKNKDLEKRVRNQAEAIEQDELLMGEVLKSFIWFFKTGTAYKKTRYEPNSYWVVGFKNNLSVREYFLRHTLSCSKSEAIYKYIRENKRYSSWRSAKRDGWFLRRVVLVGVYDD